MSYELEQNHSCDYIYICMSTFDREFLSVIDCLSEF